MPAPALAADDPLLNGAEVSRVLRVTPRVLRELRHTGALPVVRLGHKTIRYRLSDVVALIEARHQPKATDPEVIAAFVEKFLAKWTPTNAQLERVARIIRSAGESA